MSEEPASAELFDLIDAAVREILRHEDPERFLDWIRANARKLLPESIEHGDDGGAAASIALGRGIWNATPLPGNHFRPKPIPEPGRNDPCPCGSGRKYKQCCARLPQFDLLTADEIWPILISRLSRAQVDAAVAAKRIPPFALAAAAQTYLDDAKPGKAAALLEPMFESGVDRLDERFEVAFDLLCDVYVEQGNDRKRERFAERIAQEARGPLARAAWQRLAAIRHDAGRIDAAWDAIRMAHQADPGDPTVGLNELTLLVTERRLDEARARATFWAAKLTRENYPDHELIAVFRSAAQDPSKTLAQEMVAHTGADLDRLAGWFERVERQPLPIYSVRQEEALDPSDVDSLRRMARARLIAMGVAEDHVESAVERLVRDIAEAAAQHKPSPGSAAPATADLFADEVSALPAASEDEDAIFALHPPESLASLEQSWHRVFPCAKPLLTDAVTSDAESAWTTEAQADWIAFLERRPESADSLDILDDVAGAVLHLEWQLPQGAQGGLAARLIDRSCAIVERALEEHSAVLPWAVPQNRNGLRALARRIGFAIEDGDDARICELSGRILALNPNDNHGFRGLLVNSLLRRGMDAEAVALMGRYPGDATLEMQGAAILLALRRRDLPAATECLQAFVDSNRYVLDYLLRPNAATPKRTADGSVAIGSREDAWEYCEAARDVWTMTPGALEWLRRAKQSLRQLEAERKIAGKVPAKRGTRSS